MEVSSIVIVVISIIIIISIIVYFTIQNKTPPRNVPAQAVIPQPAPAAAPVAAPVAAPAAAPYKIQEEDLNFTSLQWNGTNKCLDVSGGSSANGTPIQIYDCVSGTINQKFKFTPDNQLIWKGDRDKCVDISGGRFDNGTPMQLYDCNGSISQKFVYNGFIQSQARNDFCIDVPFGRQSNGTQPTIYKCDSNNPNQKFSKLL